MKYRKKPATNIRNAEYETIQESIFTTYSTHLQKATTIDLKIIIYYYYVYGNHRIYTPPVSTTKLFTY